MSDERPPPACDKALHGLDKRTSILEFKTHAIETCLEHQTAKIDDISHGMGEIREHIAKQNGSIPSIEATLKALNGHMNGQLREELRGLKQRSTMKEKAAWTVVGTVVAGIILGLGKLILAFL